MNVDLKKITLSKNDLNSFTEDERAFFLRCLNFATDLSVFRKLMFYSIKTEPQGQFRSQRSQSLCLIFVLMGKLFEGWKMIKKELSKKNCEEISRSFNGKEKSSKKQLKKIFKTELFKSFRNKGGFHYDTDCIAQSWAQLEFGSIEIFFPKSSSWNFISNYDEILIKCIFREYIKDYSENNFEKYINNVFSEIRKACIHFDILLTGLFRFFIRKYSFEGQEFQIQVSKTQRDVELPFFVFHREPED
ncbi:MAG: hypothetical protein KC553_04510 [Nitrospina sp.]|nr:hypothetical protein [Nitrospina sp.]